MLHGSTPDTGKDPASNYKMRLGLLLFFVYAAIYAGFVAINLISPISMEATIIFGLNLAVTYGFGLIIFALVLALIYNSMCVKKEKELAASEDPEGRA